MRFHFYLFYLSCIVSFLFPFVLLLLLFDSCHFRSNTTIALKFNLILSIETLQSVLLFIARFYCCVCKGLWHSYELAGFINRDSDTYRIPCKAETKRISKTFQSISFFRVAEKMFEHLLDSRWMPVIWHTKLNTPEFENYVLIFHVSHIFILNRTDFG